MGATLLSGLIALTIAILVACLIFTLHKIRRACKLTKEEFKLFSIVLDSLGEEDRLRALQTIKERYKKPEREEKPGHIVLGLLTILVVIWIMT